MSWNVDGSRSMYSVLKVLEPSSCCSCSSKNLEKYEGALEFSVRITKWVQRVGLTIGHDGRPGKFENFRSNLYGKPFGMW